MERRTALVAAIATGLSVTVGVVAFAATGGATILGLGDDSSGAPSAGAPVVVHQVQTIEDQVVVSSSSTPVSSSSTDVPRETDRGPLVAAAPTTAVDGVSVVIGRPTTGTGSAGSTSNTAPLGVPKAPSVSGAGSDGQPAPPGPSVPVTAAAATPTAVSAPAPASTAARPAGVPASWPADQPIPPMPANCQKPQLEDNGVWNCDH